MQSQDELVSINDPGQIGAEKHNWGDRLTVRVSNLFAWIFPILMIVICTQVVLRTLGRSDIGPGNQAWMDDLQWWLYGAVVLVGIGYAVTTNSHVRVDIFYDNFPARKQRRIDVIALGWLFLPFILLCWDVTFHYAVASVVADEGSDSPNGLHNLWMLKVFMNLSFLLIVVAAWSAFSRNLSELLERPVLWKKLLYAFPTTMFVINLTVYYLLWWGVYFTSPEGTQTRAIGRHAVFDEFDFGNWEIKYTIAVTVVVTVLVLGVARAIDRGAPTATGR